MPSTLYTVDDPSGTTLTVVEIKTGWSKALRVRARGPVTHPYTNTVSTETAKVEIKTPEDRDVWCFEVREFLKNPAQTSRHITLPSKRLGGSLSRANGSIFISLKGKWGRVAIPIDQEHSLLEVVKCLEDYE